MTFVIHALDHGAPLLINSTLANVDTRDEECGLEAGGSELVENLVSVDVWAVVVGDGNGSGLQAAIDTGTAVLNAALLGTSIVASAGSSRSLVGITARTEVE